MVGEPAAVAGYRPEQVANGVRPIGRTMLYKLLKEGRIRSIKVGRARLIPAEAITDFLKSDARSAGSL